MKPEILLKLRTQKGKTQQEMANLLGITRPAYTAYESGTRKPDYATLEKLADYFEVQVDYLMGRTRDRSPSNDSISEEPIVQYIMRSKKEMTPEAYERWQQLIKDAKKAFIEKVNREEEEEKGK